MIKMRRTACLLVGAAGMYFFDPTQGKLRRARIREQLKARAAERRRALRPVARQDAVNGVGRRADLGDEPVTGDRRAELLGA
jgi:hypothetical protein